jgi:hypothetical protein
MQTHLKEVDRKIEDLKGKVNENTDGLAKTNDKMAKVEKNVSAVGKKVEDMEKKLEESMLEEMRAREAIRRNIVIHGVEEPGREVKDIKERIEADKKECEKIFKAAGAVAVKRDIRFCRRIGERGQDNRPMLVGMVSKTVKADLLEKVSRLQNSEFSDISIAPDQTRKQRQAESRLNQEVERKNREELTQEDISKNLKWMAVGRKGEKRVIKGQAREEDQAATNQQVSGRGRGRGEWRGGRASGTRQRSEEMDLGETGKRTRTDESDQEEEEERPPRTRSKQ